MIYRDTKTNEIVHVTKESPPDFRGVLFVCYRGVSPSTVNETVITADQIRSSLEPLENSESLDPELLKALRVPVRQSKRQQVKRLETGEKAALPIQKLRQRHPVAAALVETLALMTRAWSG